MNDITKQLADALRTIVADKGSAAFNDDLEAYDAAVQVAREAVAAFDAAQNGGCKPYKDSVFYVVATWHSERQIWREGFFDSAEDAANAFASYVEYYLAAMPETPAFNPEIRELEV